jgi:FKBP-type peptidyl-prolyl cis-trans isomerase FklB
LRVNRPFHQHTGYFTQPYIGDIMTRILTTISMAALLAACTASSDDMGAAGEDNTPEATEAGMSDGGTDAAMTGVSVCPDSRVIGLDDYPAETLPTAEDATVWLEQNAARDDIMVSVTGMQHKVIQAGIENGVTPEAGENVTVHYHGYFPNGEVFESSYARDTPITHTSNGFIKGWNQSLDQMSVCEARTLYVPADLAYGNSGAGGRPTGTLVFNMQLLSVNR